MDDNKQAILTIATIWVFLGSLVALVFYINSKQQGNIVQNTKKLSSKNINIEQEHAKGSDNGIILVEYADFQCPACRQFNNSVIERLEKQNIQYTYIFRHYPLNIHPNAMSAAKAAEAAGKLGKFWLMHNKLFTNQADWEKSNNPLSYFERYAKDIGLEKDKFNTLYQSQEVKREIKKDIKAAKKLNIQSTPTVYINGQHVDNNYYSIMNIIEQHQGGKN